MQRTKKPERSLSDTGEGIFQFGPIQSLTTPALVAFLEQHHSISGISQSRLWTLEENAFTTDFIALFPVGSFVLTECFANFKIKRNFFEGNHWVMDSASNRLNPQSKNQKAVSTSFVWLPFSLVTRLWLFTEVLKEEIFFLEWPFRQIGADSMNFELLFTKESLAHTFRLPNLQFSV